MDFDLSKIVADRRMHCFVAGERAPEAAIEAALLFHFPLYEADKSRRTRISVLFSTEEEAYDFIFNYKELLDNSFYRRVTLDGEKVTTSLHRPMYDGRRDDFVDVEWELITGRLSNPVIQDKLLKWSSDPERQLMVVLCYDDPETNDNYARLLGRRLPECVTVTKMYATRENEGEKIKEYTELAKYLNYCYGVSFEKGVIPAELPQDEVDAAWDAIPDERMKQSSIHNVKTIPFKMLLLGHDRADWKGFYALTAKEIESLTAVEHNRWTVERLIQGVRPCTDEERREVEEDFRLRKSDPEYAAANPVTLKKRYARGRGAHYDLCSFEELGTDETGLPVTRYDRDLTEAIPLIVKTYTDRFKPDDDE